MYSWGGALVTCITGVVTVVVLAVLTFGVRTEPQMAVRIWAVGWWWLAEAVEVATAMQTDSAADLEADWSVGWVFFKAQVQIGTAREGHRRRAELGALHIALVHIRLLRCGKEDHACQTRVHSP